MPTDAHETPPQKPERFYALGILLLGLFLYLPRLGSFGLWDPSEVKVADAARAILDPVPMRGVNQHPALSNKLVALGFHWFGTGETGGRLPLAIASILALLATYYAGRALLRPRAALIGSVALATMPSFVFGARQLTSNALIVLGASLAVGGLARLAWPSRGTSGLDRLVALLAACAGLALGEVSAGALAGIVTPTFAVAIALAFTPRRRAALVPALIGLASLVAALLEVRHKTAYGVLLGGVPHAPQSSTVVTTIVRSLGFASVPWLAITPFAFLRALDGTQTTRESDDELPDLDRAIFSRALPCAWLAIAYVVTTLQSALVADVLVPASAAVGLLAGAYLDDALRSLRLRPLEGVAIGALALVFGHDVLLVTDAFVSVQAAEVIRWPQPLYASSNVLFAFAAIFGVLVAAALAWPPGWPIANEQTRNKVQRGLLGGAVVVQIVFALALVQWFIPKASVHLSPKDLYGKTRQLDPNAPLGQYRFNATGASYYMGGRAATQLPSLEMLLTFLKRPERVFVFVGSEELASIDQASRTGGHPQVEGVGPAPPPPPATPYYVIDDANSHFLILSNKLTGQEKDLNPLKRFVSITPPSVKTTLPVNFEDKLQLLGFDIPDEIPRGADIRVRLYFKVLQPVGGAYKVFMHLDGPGSRVNGDHVPLDGKFPTQFWTAGTYVTDEYVIKPDAATEPAGAFTVYFGLYQGDKRMKVKEGPSDGENRVRLTSMRVK